MSYFFQIGLNFGQLYSTCIYRDLYNNINKSYIYEINDNDKGFLISNSIIFNNNIFYKNIDTEIHYKNTLYDIRNAVVAISKHNFSDRSLYNFFNISKNHTIPNEISDFVMACCIFLLSRILFKIRIHIIEKFSDFGKDPDDIILVNMTLPLADYQNSKVRKIFNILLYKSWKLASKDYLSPFATLIDMLKIVRCPYEHTGLCNIYPYELASSYAIKNLIVKNCFDTDIYIVISIFDITIKSYICSYRIKDKLLNTNIYMYNCYNKYINSEAINNTIFSLDDIKNYIEQQINPIFKHLKEIIIKSNLSIILLCDSNKHMLYKDFISKSLSRYITPKTKIYNIVYSDNFKDTTLNLKFCYYINYLHASYGISFIYEDLPKYFIYDINNIKTDTNHIINNNQEIEKIKYIQKSNKIKNTNRKKSKHIKYIHSNKSRNVCPYCHGQNPNCLQCGGFGYNNSIPISCSSD